jgi:hypothetical protein
MGSESPRLMTVLRLLAKLRLVLHLSAPVRFWELTPSSTPWLRTLPTFTVGGPA